jgi:hypothetical protein
MNFTVPKGLDHIEALAILVTELVHFERAFASALEIGIKEDAVPGGVSYDDASPAGESAD